METLQPKLRFPEFKGNWDRKKIGDISTIGRGKSKHRPRDAEFLYGGKYPFIQTGDIRNASLYLDSYTQTYSEEGLKQSKLWNEETLCITIAANIAETTILKIKACFPDSIIGLIPNINDATVLFVKYQFDKFKLEIQSLSQGVAQANLNQERLSKIEFNFPSLPEQARIANFLSGVDEKLHFLKEKKALLEEYKKGMMQKIFNQQIRFKDDNGEDFGDWEEKRFHQIYSFKSTNSFSRDKLNYEKGLVKNIHYGDIHSKFNSLFNIKNEKVPFINDNLNIDKISNESFLKENDLVIADASEDYEDIGKCIEIINLNDERVLAGLHTFIARPDKYKMASGFGNYLMKSDGVKIQIKTIAQGTKVLSISTTRLSEITVNIPSIKEQTKIAQFLAAIDEKIGLVGSQIEETVAYKKGLLQGMFV